MLHSSPGGLCAAGDGEHHVGQGHRRKEKSPRERSMQKKFLLSVGLISFSLVSAIGGLAVAWDGSLQVALDRRVERACHRAVGKRAPLGFRDIETVSYSQNADSSILVEGSVMARYGQDEWTTVDWTCDIHPKNKKITRIEVSSGRPRHGLI
jgi:hypothetical protein